MIAVKNINSFECREWAFEISTYLDRFCRGSSSRTSALIL